MTIINVCGTHELLKKALESRNDDCVFDVHTNVHLSNNNTILRSIQQVPKQSGVHQIGVKNSL